MRELLTELMRKPLVWLGAIIAGWWLFTGPSAASLADKGYKHFESGHYLEAVEVYQAAIRKDREYMPAYLQLGFAYDKLGQRDLAIVNLRAALPHFDPSCGVAQRASRRLAELEGGR